MEFIFQLFAEMFNMGAEENAPQQAVEELETNNVAEYESEVEDSPLAQLNFFEMVNFH